MRIKLENIKKFLLDTLLLPIFILLTVGAGSVLFHEILGIAALFLVGYHLVCNKEFIKHAIQRRLKGKETKFRLRIDMLLGICFVVTMVTGILISKELFTIETPFLRRNIRTVHETAAYLMAFLVGLHVLQHIPFLKGVSKTFWPLRKEVRVWQLFGDFGALILASYLVFMEFDKYYELKNELYSAYPPLNQMVIINEDGETIIIEDGMIEEGELPNFNSLDELLEYLICEGCSKRCTLLAPRCNIGVKMAVNAQQSYLYNEAHPTTST